MQRRTLRLSCLLLALACASRSSDADGVRSVPGACAIDSTWQQWMPRPLTLDERVAFHVAEYAGMARDTGAHREVGVIVHLTNVEVAPDAAFVVRREMERAGSDVPKHMRFIKATYSYRQLRSWLECYLRGAGAGHLTIWGVSTLDNRVGLSVAADSVRPQVEADLRRLGLPVEAFEIRVGMVRTGMLPPRSKEELKPAAHPSSLVE